MASRRWRRVRLPKGDLDDCFRSIWSGVNAEPPVTLSLSGGGDSVALFHLLLAAEVRFSALHFVHDGSEEFALSGEAFCRRLCTQFGVKLETFEIAGRPLARSGDLSLQAAWRRLRYDALAERPGTVLTAHTLDDQAETVVMRLLGGSALSGLAGIRADRGDGVVRPLLSFSRAQLRDYLRGKKLEWLDDPSNLSGSERAEIRHTIMPFLLEQRPHLESTLARTARVLAQDDDYLERCTRQWMTEAVLVGGDAWWLEEIQKAHPALQARFCRVLWQEMTQRAHRPRASLFEEVLRIVKRGTNEAEVLFPGGWAVQILGPRLWVRPALAPEGWQVSWDVGRGKFVGGALCPGIEVAQERFGRAEGWALPDGAVLRGRRPDDRFQGRCLKKLLAATGQPPWVRQRWPVLEVNGEVLAVWGLGTVDEVKKDPKIWIEFDPERLRAKVVEK